MIAKIGENIILNDLIIIDTKNLILIFMFIIVILKILENNFINNLSS